VEGRSAAAGGGGAALKPMRLLPSRQNLRIVALAIGILAFFEIHDPAPTVFLTIMRGQIWLPEWLMGTYLYSPGVCVYTIPYRWILMLAILIVALSFWSRAQKST
jgi:hypothetical protein